MCFIGFPHKNKFLIDKNYTLDHGKLGMEYYHTVYCTLHAIFSKIVNSIVALINVTMAMFGIYVIYCII